MSIDASAAGENWPPLPTQGFISGRPAHMEDFKKGDAVFVAATPQGVIGKPLAISIPQYAYWKDKKQYVIVVQAEEVRGLKHFGVRDFMGKNAVLAENDLELLGTKPH